MVGEKSKEVYNSMKDVFFNVWDNVKGVMFEKCDEFVVNVKVLFVEMDVKVSKVKVDYFDV